MYRNTGNYMIDADMGDDRMSPYYNRTEHTIECPKCEGDGTMTVDDPTDDMGYEIVVCDRCNGDGYIIE